MHEKLIPVPCSGCGRILSLPKTDKNPKPRGVCETCQARTIRVSPRPEKQADARTSNQA
jgi:hypothetical protein